MSDLENTSLAQVQVLTNEPLVINDALQQIITYIAQLFGLSGAVDIFSQLQIRDTLKILGADQSTIQLLSQTNPLVSKTFGLIDFFAYDNSLRSAKVAEILGVIQGTDALTPSASLEFKTTAKGGTLSRALSIREDRLVVADVGFMYADSTGTILHSMGDIAVNVRAGNPFTGPLAG